MSAHYKGYKCNKMKSSSGCIRLINSNRCPGGIVSPDNLEGNASGCCGRKMVSGQLTTPDSIFGDLLRESTT